jgi:DNA-binding XRE family transcriptional regulator
VITWHHGAVTTTGESENDTRRHLADLVKNRRIELNLSVRQAAENAGVARNTWAAVEDGTRRTADNNYAGIERALLWAPGSILRIQRGHEPLIEAPSQTPTSPTTQPDDADEALIKIMRSDRLTDQEKAQIVRLLIAERERARRRLIEMAESFISEAGSGS